MNKEAPGAPGSQVTPASIYMYSDSQRKPSPYLREKGEVVPNRGRGEQTDWLGL
jgi:hypothetical protein